MTVEPQHGTEGSGRPFGVALAALATLAGLAGLALFWAQRANDKTRESFARPVDLPVVEPANTSTTSRPLRPLASLAEVPPVTFADGSTARLVRLERVEDDRGLGIRVLPEERKRLANADPPGRLVVIRVEFADAQPASEQDHVIRVDGRVVSRWESRGWGTRDARATIEVAVAVEADADRVRIGVAKVSEPWTVVQRLRPGDPETPPTPGEPPAPLRMAQLLGRPGGTAVVCDDQGIDRGRLEEGPWLMQAICADGRVVESIGTTTRDGMGRLVLFPVPLAEVDRVELRHCLSERQTFGEIPLPPIAAIPPATTMPAVVPASR